MPSCTCAREILLTRSFRANWCCLIFYTCIHATSACQFSLHNHAGNTYHTPPCTSCSVRLRCSLTRAPRSRQIDSAAPHGYFLSRFRVGNFRHDGYLPSHDCSSVASLQTLCVNPHPVGACSRYPHRWHHKVWAELFGPACGLTRLSQVPFQGPCQSSPPLLSFSVDVCQFSIHLSRSSLPSRIFLQQRIILRLAPAQPLENSCFIAVYQDSNVPIVAVLTILGSPSVAIRFLALLLERRPSPFVQVDVWSTGSCGSSCTTHTKGPNLFHLASSISVPCFYSPKRLSQSTDY